MRNRYLLLLGALAFLCPILLQPLRLAGMQAPAQTFTLRGTITRAGTSEPIPDVQVSIGSGRGNFNAQSLQSLQQTIATATAAGIAIPPAIQAQLEAQQAAQRGGPNAPIQMNATSDRDGHFVFRDIPPGQYTVRAEREGYFGAYLNAITAGNPPTFVQSTLNLAAGQTPPDISLSLTPGGAISGTATDSEGRPVVGASVQAYRVNYQNGYPVLQAGLTASTTDDRGAYRLFRIPPGDYYLEVTPGGGRGGFVASNRGGVAPKQGLVRTFYPDAMEAKNARMIALRGGEDMTGTAIAVRTSPLISISGQIVSTVPLPTRAGPRGNAIIQNPSLILVSHDPNALEVGGARQAGNATMDSPTSGQFQLTGIAPGSYDLYARVLNPNGATGALIDIGGFGGTTAPGQPPAGPNYYFGRTAIEAGFQDLQGITLAMSGGVEVKVFVTVDGSAAAAAGNVRLALTSADSARFFPVYANGGGAQMLAAPDGSITIPFVYEGVYRFQASINASNGTNVAANPARTAGPRGQGGAPAGPSYRDAYVEDIREGGLSVYDNGLTVGKQSPRPIEVIVKTNGGIIEGDVYDVQQQLKAGVAVVLAPAQARRQNSALYKTTQSNAMGHFTLRAIPPGQYKLFAFESVANGAFQDPAFIAKYEERGRAVTVNASSTASAQVTLIAR